VEVNIMGYNYNKGYVEDITSKENNK
jgi:hypothetical protein